MSNVIGFLEQAGMNAAMRHASREQLLQSMQRADIDAFAQVALLQPHLAPLNTLLGVRDTMYCKNQSTEKPKKKAPAKKSPAKKAPAKNPAKKPPAKRKA